MLQLEARRIAAAFASGWPTLIYQTEHEEALEAVVLALEGRLGVCPQGLIEEQFDGTLQLMLPLPGLLIEQEASVRGLAPGSFWVHYDYRKELAGAQAEELACDGLVAQWWTDGHGRPERLRFSVIGGEPLPQKELQQALSEVGLGLSSLCWVAHNTSGRRGIRATVIGGDDVILRRQQAFEVVAPCLHKHHLLNPVGGWSERLDAFEVWFFYAEPPQTIPWNKARVANGRLLPTSEWGWRVYVSAEKVPELLSWAEKKQWIAQPYSWFDGEALSGWWVSQLGVEDYKHLPDEVVVTPGVPLLPTDCLRVCWSTSQVRVQVIDRFTDEDGAPWIERQPVLEDARWFQAVIQASFSVLEPPQFVEVAGAQGLVLSTALPPDQWPDVEFEGSQVVQYIRGGEGSWRWLILRVSEQALTDWEAIRGLDSSGSMVD